MAVDLYALSRGVHLEGFGCEVLATLHQGGKLFLRAFLLLPRGDVLQARQVNQQDFPPVVLSRVSKTEILYVDTGAIPNHLRVQVFVLIFSKEVAVVEGGVDWKYGFYCTVNSLQRWAP